MNGESARGGAFGFKLDVIVKSGDMKSNDGKYSLLMMITDLAERVYGKDLITEDWLESIEFLSKLPLNQMNIDINEVKKI